MAIPHAKPAEIINLGPLGAKFSDAQTQTLIKIDSLEVIRLVMPAEKEIAPHRVPGEITVHCLEGKILFRARNIERRLTAGEMLYLEGSDEHSLKAIEDASLLVTIVLER